ncbi:MAG: serine hydrolase domain-containing protein [Parasphingorhabdus sp.]
MTLERHKRAGAICFCLFLCLLGGGQALAESPDQLAGSPAAIRVDFTKNKISVKAIQGFSNRSTGRALMPDDPVRVASVSKFFVALGVMRLVEAGKLDLHTDINQYLDWSIRNPAFPDDPITLSHLMSHQSGLRDGINYALPMDVLLEDELSNPEAWEPDHKPGTYFAYANLNSPVIAAVMEAATDERFDQIMQDEVFKPLKLDACFNWVNCRDAKIVDAVTLYRPNGDVARDDLRGVREKCSVVPAKNGSCNLTKYQLGKTGSVFSPQGGLRISAMDLARVGQMFLREGEGFLKSKTLQDMADPIWTYDGTNGDTEEGYFCAYALGIHISNNDRGSHADCNDDPFDNGYTYWGHSGDAYSLKSGLWFTDGDYSGTAFFRTEVPEDDPVGHCIYFCE